jgi:hypothetical protein
MVVQEVEQHQDVRRRTRGDDQELSSASARCGAYLRRAGRCLERYVSCIRRTHCWYFPLPVNGNTDDLVKAATVLGTEAKVVGVHARVEDVQVSVFAAPCQTRSLS